MEVAFQTSGNYGLEDLPCHKGSEAGEKATRLRGAGKAREARRRKLGRASQRKHLLYPSNDVQREVCTVSLKWHSSLNTVKTAVFLLGKG